MIRVVALIGGQYLLLGAPLLLSALVSYGALGTDNHVNLTPSDYCFCLSIKEKNNNPVTGQVCVCVCEGRGISTLF